MRRLLSIAFLLIIFGQPIRADISHLAPEEIERIALERIQQVSFEEYLEQQQADYEQAASNNQSSLAQEDSITTDGGPSSHEETSHVNTSSSNEPAPESNLHLVLRLRGQQSEPSSVSSATQGLDNSQAMESLVSGDSNQLYLILRLRGNSAIETGSTPTDGADESEEATSVEETATTIGELETQAGVETLPGPGVSGSTPTGDSQTKDQDILEYVEPWSYDCGDMATNLLIDNNFKSLRTLLKVMPHDDLMKQGWVCTLAQENMHPFLLLEHSNLLLTQDGDREQALAFYLLGLRRLIEDAERLWSKDCTKNKMVKRIVSHFTNRYGFVFRDQGITREERKIAMNRGNGLYRAWRNNSAIEKVSRSGKIRYVQSDENLVDPRWLVNYGNQHGLKVYDPWVLPSVKNPVCSTKGHASETVKALLYSRDSEVFGPDGPGQLLQRLTHRYRGSE